VPVPSAGSWSGRASYQQIKDEVRRAMAFERLREGELSIAEIAEQAVSEPSAFHRAFKKWTGHSPGSYRARIGRGTGNQ
jgi:AraC-like DNA-binding protein